MDCQFLAEENWPAFGQGNHSATSKILHEWCGKISQFLLSLSDRINNIEKNEKQKYERLQLLESEKVVNVELINQLKFDIAQTSSLVKQSSTNDWIQVQKSGKQVKKPNDQLIIANSTINELNERKKRAKNIIIYGVSESDKVSLDDKEVEIKAKVLEIFTEIGVQDINFENVRRLRSKISDKPDPLLVNLADSNLQNKILISSKKLKLLPSFKNIYISPDLTDAERQQDFILRTERNKLNNALKETDPFWYGIRGNQIQKFKKKPIEFRQ